MPKQDRKSKMISLRLTAGEYAALHALYPSYGARNVSDLARLASQQVTSVAVGAESDSSPVGPAVKVPNLKAVGSSRNTISGRVINSNIR
jgi:hypothetical protein